MSVQETSSGGGNPLRTGNAKNQSTTLVCPECERSMIVKQVIPVLFASELDDVVFGCDKCGTEAKRTVKRS